ncbi:putative nuclease HARBI1 [Chionoecetes opilio]|uniref:Putative nuclease HARBI1 n=1 Tax=Chionoecetes opilio TaxID=41210 RepID=A0A8J5CQE3_CHIOP|nr:putative nuclease HARBI1 [Chionoecetes opilio]
MADCNEMSQQSVSHYVKNVTYAICQVAAEFIKFPSPAENTLMRDFEEVAVMPGIIGCVDGTLIHIKSPGGPDAEHNRGRKVFFALNVMAVCDANMVITNLVVNWPGSAHDSRVYRESGLCAALERGEYRGVLLGDKGYRCDYYLFTPLRNLVTAKDYRYNAAHAKTRNLIERTFGILKRRFGVLGKCLRTEL